MPQPFVRADVWTLPANDPVLTEYADAVAAMQAKSNVNPQDPTGWTYQAAIHGTYAANPLSQWNQCRHGTWYFVSWHRMYVYYFERIVRAQVIANGGSSDWALPYWNYDGGSNHNTLPLAFRPPTGGSVNPLYIPQRNPSINAGAGLPASITSPAFALSRPQFTGASEFGGGVTSWNGQFWGETGRLEQTPHNDVHVAIGGWMGDPDTAAQDPIFWLHHANIDRLWWLWEQTHSNPTDPPWTDQPFGFMDVGGAPAQLTGAGVLDTVKQLGYTYTQGPPFPKPHKRLIVHWPLPWPHRPPRPDPPPDIAGKVERHLVGATAKPISLVGDATTVPVAIDKRATEAIAASADAGQLHHRAFIDVEDIEAEQNPGTVYGVYVNLPSQPSDADVAAHHIGNISLFGVERARAPRGDEGAHGLRVSMDVTDLLDRLAEQGTWHDGDKLDVTFRPIALEPPEGEADDAALAETKHPDLPITIGRVSVHYA